MSVKYEDDRQLLIVFDREKVPHRFPKSFIETKRSSKIVFETLKKPPVLTQPQKQKINCKYCEKSFKSKGWYYNHLDVHKIDGKLPKPGVIIPKPQVKIQRTVQENKQIIKLSQQKKQLTNDTKKIQTHTKPKNFNCDLCAMQFESKQRIKLHIERQHLKYTTCTLCGKRLYFKKLKKHLENHKPIIEVNKEQYSIVQESIENRRKIYRQIVEIKINENAEFEAKKASVNIEFIPKTTRLKCKFCANTFKTEKGYYKHLNSHNINDKLHHPEKDQKYKSKLQNNISINENYFCDICGKYWPYKTNLKSHIISSHLLLSECKICHKKLRRTNEKTHMLSHLVQRNFNCKICNKTFKSPSNVTTHVRTVHNKRHKCKVCGKMFGTRLAIRLHESTHQKINEKFFECKFCGMRFTRINRLTTHERNHKTIKGQKSLNCFRCNFSTDLKNSLKIHQRGHELKDKKAAEIKNPVNCEKCPAVLRNKQALRNHMTNCHPVAPYECDLCGRVINAKTNFTKHINYHLNMSKIS